MAFLYNNIANINETSDAALKSYSALTLVSASCHAVLNTSLIKPEPKLDEEGNDMFAWFDDVKSRLDDAKVVANDWLNNIVTPIQSDIPVSIINFDNQFQATTEYVLKICQENPHMKKGDEAFEEVNILLQALIDTIDKDIILPMDYSREALVKWGETLQNAHDGLSGKVKVIQDAEIELSTEIEMLNTDIETLYNLISSESTLVSVGAGLVGGGIFVALVGVALCATGVGAVAGGLVIGVGAAMTIGGAVTWGIMQGRINKQYKEIAEHRKEINEDKQLLVSLKGLESGTTFAVANMQIALSALDEVKTMWLGFRNIVAGTVTDLDKAEQSATAILKEMFADAAIKQWQDAKDIAMKLLESKVEVQDNGQMGDQVA